MAQNNKPDDLAILEERVASHPISIEDISALADAYADRELWQEAIETYKTAISLDPTNGDLYNRLGIAYDEVDKLEDAEQAYQQAIALNPETSDAYYNLGCLYEDQKRIPEAIQAYKKYLQYLPEVDELTVIKKSLPQLTRMKIRKIDALSLAKISGLLYTGAGLIFSGMVALFSLVSAFYYRSNVNLSMVLTIIFMPIIYGVVGFISGLIIAALYDLAAAWVGGIEVEAE